jgi:predicted ATPase
MNRLQGGEIRSILDAHLRRFYEQHDSLHPRVEGGTIQLTVVERGLGGAAIPATRLSDGTIRFISLLAILCNPKPPPLLCIEEPGLALHPDVIPLVAELLRDASQRTQLIVTTHSRDLIDQFTDEPESVVVCERGFDSATQMSRLSKPDLEEWLERYTLGQLWEKGEIGGTRW